MRCIYVWEEHTQFVWREYARPLHSIWWVTASTYHTVQQAITADVKEL